MTDKINRITSEAVKKATGKTWDEWIELLDARGANTLQHRDIAKFLYDEGLIKSGWWAQMVTVGYEYAHNRRTMGETEGAGFEIGVQKTFDLTPDEAWDFITSAKGMAVWLGKPTEIAFERGYQYETEDGVKGEIRSIDKARRLRFTWQPPGRKEPSTVQILFLPNGDPSTASTNFSRNSATVSGLTRDGSEVNKCAIRFHQERLKDAAERETMRKHWQKVLEQLSDVISENFAGGA